MQEVYKNIYMDVFPLTGNPLKSINIFVIKSNDRNMIIDTGFNNPENRNNMDELIEKLNLDLSKTDLFLTHLHSDHVGLSSYLKRKGLRNIYISKVDGEIVKTGIDINGIQWQSYMRNSHRQGLDVDNLNIEDHPGYKNRPRERFPFIPVNVGDKINIGEFNFTVIDESGHTPGMVGLYEKNKKILFYGDHILYKITPNITFWSEEFGDSLGIYLKNLEKIKDLNIKYLFSSHRQLVKDVNKRIDEIKAHHKKRLDETREIIKKHPRSTTRDVTKNLNWDIKAKNRDDFPDSQKWFAAGEAQAHIYYLEERNEVLKEILDGIDYYTIK